MQNFYICRCFYTENYFVRSINAHLKYENDEQFNTDYMDIITQRRASMDTILNEMHAEKRRRIDVVEGSESRRALIRKNYTSLHPELYNLQESFFEPEFLSLWKNISNGEKGSLKQYAISNNEIELYQFPVFNKDFCKRLLEEVGNFEKTDLPKLRPNTMNYRGILLDEIGFRPFFDELRTKYLSQLSKAVFPEWCGEGLDSHRVFTVSYNAAPFGKAENTGNSTRSQSDLALHYDNAEVTLNVLLNDGYSGGELDFNGLKTDQKYKPNTDLSKRTFVEQTKLGWGVLHKARQLHSALPIDHGERHNLIFWMRSSSIRNENCPMCWKKPSLIPVSSGDYGDGFTSSMK